MIPSVNLEKTSSLFAAASAEPCGLVYIYFTENEDFSISFVQGNKGYKSMIYRL